VTLEQIFNCISRLGDDSTDACNPLCITALGPKEFAQLSTTSTTRFSLFIYELLFLLLCVCCAMVYVCVCVCVTSSLPVRGPVADFWTLKAAKSSVRKVKTVCVYCVYRRRRRCFCCSFLFIFLFWRSNFKWPALFIYYCTSTRRCNCSCWHNNNPNQLLTTGRVSSRNINRATATESYPSLQTRPKTK